MRLREAEPFLDGLLASTKVLCKGNVRMKELRSIEGKSASGLRPLARKSASLASAVAALLGAGTALTGNAWKEVASHPRAGELMLVASPQLKLALLLAVVAALLRILAIVLED